jgi:hypothetical protein
MEQIANDFLQRGDVASALPILGTLALAAGTNAEQRRRRLLHARIHREASAVMHCVSGQSLREEQRAAICDAILDKDLPSAVLFGQGSGVEATKRLQTLRLAVHPDKCAAPKAAEAITRLHDRRADHEASVAASMADEAVTKVPTPPPVRTTERDAREQESSPSSTTLRHRQHHPPRPSSSQLRGKPTPSCNVSSGASSPKFSASPSSPKMAASPKAGRFPPFSTASPLAATTGRMRTSAASPSSPVSMLRRTAPPREADDLRSLLAGFRQNSSVKLQSDLSFDSCTSTESPPPPLPEPAVTTDDHLTEAAPRHRATTSADAHDARMQQVLSNTVATEFDRVRNALLDQLSSAHPHAGASVGQPPDGDPVDDALAATLSEAFSASFEPSPHQSPAGSSVTTRVTTKRRVIVGNNALLPSIRPRQGARR